jgi:hypothetical protein
MWTIIPKKHKLSGITPRSSNLMLIYDTRENARDACEKDEQVVRVHLETEKGHLIA